MAESLGRRDGNWQRGQRRTAPPLIKQSTKREPPEHPNIPWLNSLAAMHHLRPPALASCDDQSFQHGDCS
jgi:hypothetical protein